MAISLHDVLRALVRQDRAVNEPGFVADALAAIDKHEADQAAPAPRPPASVVPQGGSA